MLDTSKEALQRPLFYLLILLAGYLSLQILGPFLAPLGWAAILAIILHGVQVTLSARIGRNRAAGVITAMAGLCRAGRAGGPARRGAASGGAAGDRLPAADLDQRAAPD
jgi:hypothetical protein